MTWPFQYALGLARAFPPTEPTPSEPDLTHPGAETVIERLVNGEPVVVDLADYTPTYANPGAVINRGQIPSVKGRARKCVPCEVQWYGEDPCWSCGDAA